MNNERYRYGERNQTNLGTLSWIGLGAYVLAADLLVEESLTHSFQRGLDSNRMRPLLLGGMAIIGLHLTDHLPRPVDPLYMIQSVGQFALKHLNN